MRIRLLALALVLASASSLFAQTATKKASGTAKRTTAARPSLLKPASLKAQAPAVYKAKFTTTKGDFVVEVTRAWAPLGADRFYNLVKNGFYTNAAFFRVLPGFVAQVGIPARPEVARAWYSAHIPDDPVAQSNLRGYVTFAKSRDPNSRTTQIFINYADNTRLDGAGFSPFGKIVEGMEVVEGLYADYGEGAPQGNGPDQGRIVNEGKAYLDKEFPKLDTIKAAVIVGEPAATISTPAPAKPKAATSSTTKPAATKSTATTKENQ